MQLCVHSHIILTSSTSPSMSHAAPNLVVQKIYSAHAQLIHATCSAKLLEAAIIYEYVRCVFACDVSRPHDTLMISLYSGLT